MNNETNYQRTPIQERIEQLVTNGLDYHMREDYIAQSENPRMHKENYQFDVDGKLHFMDNWVSGWNRSVLGKYSRGKAELKTAEGYEPANKEHLKATGSILGTPASLCQLSDVIIKRLYAAAAEEYDNSSSGHGGASGPASGGCSGSGSGGFSCGFSGGGGP
jgi:hypothetical protein